MSLETFVRVGSAMAGTYLAVSAIQDIREKATKLQKTGYKDLFEELVTEVNKGTWLKIAGSAASYYLMYRSSDLFAPAVAVAVEYNPKYINGEIKGIGDAEADLGCYDRDDPINEAYKSQAKAERVHRHHAEKINNIPSPAPAPQPAIDANNSLALVIEPFEMEVDVNRIMQEAIEESDKFEFDASRNAGLREMFDLPQKPGSDIV